MVRRREADLFQEWAKAQWPIDEYRLAHYRLGVEMASLELCGIAP